MSTSSNASMSIDRRRTKRMRNTAPRWWLGSIAAAIAINDRVGNPQSGCAKAILMCMLATQWIASAQLQAQTEWRAAEEASAPGARDRAAMCYDSARDRMILIGGGSGNSHIGYRDMWEHDGARWLRKVPPALPPDSVDAALVFDTVRGVAVLHYDVQTWEWNGADWRQQKSSSEPTAMGSESMVFDQGRGRTVLFGGLDDQGQGYLNETWEWDGATWSKCKPAHAPPARANASMAYDTARSRVVLFGGHTFNTTRISYNDTWEYDGVDWTQRTPATPPPARRGPVMVYHGARARTLLFGGNVSATSQFTSDIWEWDGTNWRKSTTAPGPEPLAACVGAYDTLRQRMLIFGGDGDFLHIRANTWTWNGTSWKQLVPVYPTPVYGHGMAYDSDRKRMMLFGGDDGTNGHSDIWEREDNRWRLVPAVTRPKYYGPLAYDPVRKVTMYWETINYPPSSTMWEWDGKLWNRQALTSPPPFRYADARVFDTRRNRLVVFGGRTVPSGFLNDTWEWDGRDWQQIFPPVSPAARGYARVTYDESLGCVVLVGGGTTTVGYQDTWAYDGKTWTRIGNGYPIYIPTALAYDPVRQKMVLFGSPAMGADSQLAEWDGGAWRKITLPVMPPARGSTALVYDPERKCMVLFGGNGDFDVLADTWELVMTSPAGWRKVGQGCAGSAGVPELGLNPSSNPWLGGTVIAEVSRIGAVPALNLPFVLLGDSKSTLGSLNLPLDLGPFGMPTCTLYTNAKLSFPLQNRGGRAVWTLPIPNNLALMGRTFYPQAGVLDPAANPLGLVLSNSAEMTLGWR